MRAGENHAMVGGPFSQADRMMFYLSAREPLIFCFLMVDNLSMMSLSSGIEPLRSANRLLGRTVFQWRLCSINGESITASNGIVLAAQPIEAALEGANAIFICGGMRIDPQSERPYLAALRLAARRGLAIGSLSTGSHFLARAGLLDGYRCTIHWENSAAFAEDFPNVLPTGKIYEIDRNRMTCSGGTAAMDMMLRIISDRFGADLAKGVANQFHHERIRDAGEEQQGGRQQQVDALPVVLQKAVSLMQRNLENPKSVEEVGAEVKLSSRQLERLFSRHLGMTPARYYLSLRIDRARELLLYTEQPVIDIAVAVGFASTSHFSNWFQRFHGQRPSEMREKARADRRNGRTIS